MEQWLILTGAIVIATRVLATSRPSGRQVAHAEMSAAVLGWTPVLKAFAILAGIAGLALRLVGFGDSLSGDEFGTLWAVESNISTVVERSWSFHGQSPFYYLISWLSVNLLGESEIALRLPSFLFVIGTAWLVYQIGAMLAGVRGGVFSATVFWWAVMSFRAASDARPYALGLLLASLALFGFVKAAIDGRASGRAWFVIGGFGLIAAHYLLALMLLGIGLAYLVAAPLRERYPMGRFSLDVALITLLSAPLLPQVLALWNRRSELDWVPQINYKLLYLMFGAETTLVAAALAAGAFWQCKSRIKGALSLLTFAAIAPPLVLIGLALLGTNLLVPRYMISALVPVCVLAGVGFSLVPMKSTHFGWFGWTSLNALALFVLYQQDGSFTSAGYQEWRGATAALNQRIEDDPTAPVLFRSGFVEDDQRALGREVSSVLLAPLRSPGQSAPRWKTIPLTHTWRLKQREPYFERIIPAVIGGQDVFYYFSSIAGDGYEERFAVWMSQRFSGKFRPQWLNAGQGMVMIRFSATGDATDL